MRNEPIRRQGYSNRPIRKHGYSNGPIRGRKYSNGPIRRQWYKRMAGEMWFDFDQNRKRLTILTIMIKDKEIVFLKYIYEERSKKRELNMKHKVTNKNKNYSLTSF